MRTLMKGNQSEKGKRRAVICDIDGTVAHMSERSPYDWSRVHEDTVDETIKGLLRMLNERYLVILVSGRDESCRKLTTDWLDANKVPYNYLFMRPAKDNRKDVAIKQEILDSQIKGRFNILLVLDDRDQVVNMWRSNGLKCLQVAPGDF